MAKKLVRVVAWTFAVLVGVVAYIYVEGRPPKGQPQYVAMGSSYAAGPAVTQEDAKSPWFCGRSRDNYAHQLAKLRGLSLVDVSCGGATTEDILGGGLLMQAPQINAVTAETELVTMTIGGNDVHFVGNTMALACDDHTPWYVRLIGGCKTLSLEAMQQALPKVHDHLIAIIDSVHQRAPKARMVLVTYPVVFPQVGTCRQLGLTDAEVAQMRLLGEKLAEVTAAAAKERGALLMDAKTVTEGHDVCAEYAWINSTHPEGGLLKAPLHPTLAGMTAIAKGLNSLLGQ